MIFLEIFQFRKSLAKIKCPIRNEIKQLYINTHILITLLKSIQMNCQVVLEIGHKLMFLFLLFTFTLI